MGSIFIVLAACLAAAAAAAAAVVARPSEQLPVEQNNIDIFFPKPLTPNYDPSERVSRSFYWGYWLYPGMMLNNRARCFGEEPSSFFSNYVEPLTFKDVFEKPVVVVTPSQNGPSTFSMFYLQSGLRSLHRYNAFAWLQEYFKQPGMKGLIFYPRLMYNVRFFETPVSSVSVQEDLRMSDFVKMESLNGKIPYVFVAPEEIFDRMHFDNIAKVSDFKVYRDAIEVYPVVLQTRPLYEPFYGPPAGEENVKPKPESVPSGSVGLNNFREFDVSTGASDGLMQSGNLDMSHVGRAVYGNMAGQYPLNEGQYLIANPGESYVNYGTYQLGATGGLRSLLDERQSAESYQQGTANAVAQTEAYGAGRNILGTQMGGKVGLQSGFSKSEAQFGSMSTNKAQNVAGAQLHYYVPAKVSGTFNMQSGIENLSKTGSSQVQSGSISRSESGSVSEQLTGGSRLVEVQTGGESSLLSGKHVSKVDAVSRIDTGSASRASAEYQSSGQSNIHSSVMAQQNEISLAAGSRRIAEGEEGASGALAESVSRSTSRGSAESQLSGQSNIHSSVTQQNEISLAAGSRRIVGGIEGVSGAHSESVSRTSSGSIEKVAESEALGHSQAHSSGVSLQNENLLRTESEKFKAQSGVQSEIIGASTTSSVSRADVGIKEQVMDSQISSVSGTSQQSGSLVRTEGTYGGLIGAKGGLEGNFGLLGGHASFGISGNVGAGLLKPAENVAKIISSKVEGTTQHLGSLVHHGQGWEQQQPLADTSSTSVTKSSSSSFSSVHFPPVASVETSSFGSILSPSSTGRTFPVEENEDVIAPLYTRDVVAA